MLKINSELVKKISQLKEIESYISIVVDYKKEEEYSNLQNEVVRELTRIEDFFTGKDIHSIINGVDIEESKEYYLYDADEIIEILFPSGSKKNDIIQSAYNWIDSKKRIEWLCLNVLYTKEWYETINNVNDNYIISTRKL